MYPAATFSRITLIKMVAKKVRTVYLVRTAQRTDTKPTRWLSLHNGRPIMAHNQRINVNQKGCIGAADFATTGNGGGCGVSMRARISFWPGNILRNFIINHLSVVFYIKFEIIHPKKTDITG
jgi:hypothetical protein